VSIHHNGGTHPPAGLGPGTETYHERDDADSRRLAGVLWEQIVAGLSRFEVNWVASQYRGALWRADRDGDDFYGLLRRADTVPAVILEAAYMSGEAEAQLMLTDEFRATEAEAIAAGIQRWLTTDDPAPAPDRFTLDQRHFRPRRVQGPAEARGDGSGRRRRPRQNDQTSRSGRFAENEGETKSAAIPVVTSPRNTER
jgi:hypothetical protein